jgi:hypothetical protein
MFPKVLAIALFVTCAGLFASDKPASQAKEWMEDMARGEGSTVISEGGVEIRAAGDTVLVNEQQPQFTSVTNDSRAEIIPAEFETRDFSLDYWDFNRGTKPAAQARLNGESGR